MTDRQWEKKADICSYVKTVDREERKNGGKKERKKEWMKERKDERKKEGKKERRKERKNVDILTT